MAYQMGNGRWADTDPVTLFASAARTASANGSAVELGDCAVARLDLKVTAASGTTPTLVVKVQTSPDGTTWADVGTAFTQATAATTEHKIVSGLDRFVRGVATIASVASSVTKSGTGPNVTLTGTPTLTASCVIKVILGGAVATATFQYSTDGGTTWSETKTTAATYLIPGTGLTAAFASGTYVADDTYSFTTALPSFTFSLEGEAV